MTAWFGSWFGYRVKGWLPRCCEARSGETLKTLASELSDSTLEDIGLTRAGTMLVQGSIFNGKAPDASGKAPHAMRNSPCCRRTDGLSLTA